MDSEISKPFSGWFHVSLQLIVGVLLVYWYWYVPVANKAVLCLAGVAAIMVLVDMKPIHKAVYIFLVVGLMFVENRAINKDRADQVRDESTRRLLEDQQFADVGATIRTNFQRALDLSQKQFVSTLNQQAKQFEATMRREQVAIDEITGGDSYVVVRPDFLDSTGKTVFPLVATLCDRCVYSVPDAYIYAQPDLESNEYGTLLYHGSVHPSFPLNINGTLTVPVGDEYGIRITVLARNRATQEQLRTRFNTQKRRWECTWIIGGEETHAHQDPRTKKIVPGKAKTLEMVPWTTPSTVMNRAPVQMP